MNQRGNTGNLGGNSKNTGNQDGNLGRAAEIT